MNGMSGNRKYSPYPVGLVRTPRRLVADFFLKRDNRRQEDANSWARGETRH